MKRKAESLLTIIVTVLTAILLAGCYLTPKTVEKAVKRMERQGYIVEVNDDPKDEYAHYGAKAVLYCTEEKDPTNTMTAIFFGNESRAKNFFNDNDYRDSFEVYRQDGYWVFFGTEEAEYDFTY